MNPRPNNKKNRSTSNRGGKQKSGDRTSGVDGVYGNHRFMQSVTSLIGLPIQVLTKTKEMYEGVFSTFGPNFEMVLDLPHVVSPGGESCMVTSTDLTKKTIIFPINDIVLVKVLNVDMDFATTKESFPTDSSISKYNGQIQAEKELEPWHGEETVYTDLGLGDENANGWDADDMFKKNEEKYGVKTTYNPEMEGYTTPLQKKNTKEWKEQEAKAQQIAQEIEHSPATLTRAELENGEDEEDKFSAVMRLDQGANMGPTSGKYMPPQRRKIQDGRGNKQLPRSGPSPQSVGPSIPVTVTGGRYSSHSNISSSSSSYNNSINSNISSSNNNSSNNNSLQSSSIPNSASTAASQPLGTSYNQQQISSQLKHQNKHASTNISSSNNNNSNNNANNSLSSSQTHPQPAVIAAAATVPAVSSQKQPLGHQHQQQMSQETKLNGESKDSRRLENFSSYGREHPTYKESYHPSEHSVHHGGHPHHPQQHHHHGQHNYSHQAYQQSYHSSDSRRSEPREQREPRKPRNQKDEQQIADLKKFGQDFKLCESSLDKKVTNQQQPPRQYTPPTSMPVTKPSQNTHIPPQVTTPSQSTTSAPTLQHQTSTSIPSQRQSPATEPQAANCNTNNNINAGVQPSPQPAQQQQQPQQQPPPPPPPSAPQSQSSQTSSQVSSETSSQHDSKGSEDENSSVVNSNLNPNAKEFVFNPNAKPFNPRSPSTTTPPRVQTPQIAPQPPPPQSQIGTVPPVGFQQNMLHYVMAQPFPVQSQPRFPKRGPGGNQRTDYASSMQVAAATGHPILAPTPLTSITSQQTIPAAAVPIPQNIMPQAAQHYQYQPMMLRLPPPGIPMVTTMVPTSMGVYYHGAEGHQNSQGHTPPHMYVTPGVPPHQGHQPHPVANPGPHPGQPPTPQGHSSGGPAPNMPAQPPTPGPTPPQAMMYGGPGGGPIGGQPTIPQHLSQHSPHTGQSHNPYQNPNAALAAAAAAAAAASQHHPTATQLVMIPPHLAPHMMPPGGAPPPPPHSGAGHAPSSAAGYTATSSASMQQHVNHGHHVHYIPGTVGNAVHPIPLVHPNQ